MAWMVGLSLAAFMITRIGSRTVMVSPAAQVRVTVA
jgi:hypothetical protein